MSSNNLPQIDETFNYAKVRSILTRPDNSMIQHHIDQILTIIKNKDESMIIQTWTHITEINLILNEIEPWCSLSKIKFPIAQERLESYILSLIYPLWITPKMINDDLSFHDKVISLLSLVTPEFMCFNISKDRQSLIENAIDEVHMIDCSTTDSPMHLMYHIHECCNSLYVARNIYKSSNFGADDLISVLVYVIIQALPEHLISNCQWIEYWYTPKESRSDESFCMYTNFIVAIAYICSLEPESSLVKVDLNDDNPPEIITHRFSTEEYILLIEPIRKAINNLQEIEERAKGATIGATIGAAVASPFAVLSAVLTTGFGIPISIGIITAGVAIGSTFGAIVPLTVRKSLNDIAKCVEHINNGKLKQYGIAIINPFVTNRIYLTTVSLSNVKYLEFIVKSLHNPT